MKRTFGDLFPKVVYAMQHEDTDAVEETMTKREHFALTIFCALIHDDDTAQVITEKSARAGSLADILLTTLKRQADARLLHAVRQGESP